MKKISFLFAAMMFSALGTGFSPLSIGLTQAAEATDQSKQMSVRAEMGKPLAEIQDLLEKKQYPLALEKINALNALDKKTPYELFIIDRMHTVLAAGTNDTAMLAQSVEAMLTTDFLKPSEKLQFIDVLAGTFYNEKKYPEAITWSKRYLALDSQSESMQKLLARAYYLSADYPNAITTIKAIISGDQQAKRAPTEENLRLLASCYQHEKNDAGYTEVLDLMVQHHPSREYWGDLLYRVERQAGFADRLRLDLYRLLLKTNNLDDGAQYVEMSELAMLAGLPAEAKTTVDAGYAANLLGSGKEAAKHKQLRDRVYKQAADDAKSLDSGEAAAKTAKVGTGLVNIGYNYVINGQAEKGIALIEQGIAKGGLKSLNEAKLHLGIAYLQVGDRAKASDSFSSLQAGDGASDLARLWLYLRPAADAAPAAAK
ncbi:MULTISPECIES: hypothetical protein [unclassified Undibacterium]|uniref:tetratricopeptide repeat protein n=1 Tax=unclassified Undibacterium TaxID=2630295 RepID=UPI002AC91D42|nr:MULTISPECIES: hypothetical protein [unclassified Undibacterium]MEB0140610.1 hypothetical protein [Undibacterium sp. CCC2.1]MEB0173484.1 hypothetical protein [Undibacterium sp. CCC1.1]MEB0177614.1 hypothetical protein [Undibacterium sp. CCC3.4]MEB0216788.1 hypothetical protein [Undibacterium sp. 5I2]WPX44662.1 hypothetical protein RHM61_05390 [Undibacterium sp. CCC3.4]